MTNPKLGKPRDHAPALEALLGFIREYHAPEIDIPANALCNLLGLPPDNKIGPYFSRFNSYAQKHKSPCRLVPGKGKNTYRLILLA